MRAVLLGVCCLLMSAWVGLVQGQRVTTYHLEAGSLISSGQTPFWLRANRYGIVPLRSPIVQLNAAIQRSYQPADSSGNRSLFDWGYGANVVVNAGRTNQVLLPEAYVKGRFGAFEVYAGRRRELVGLVDTLLTTGAYAWSGNALPIPKVQIGLPTYTSLPFTKGAISFLGAFAHGWFENAGRIVKGSYLHQTYLYGRIGKPSWRFRLYGGFNHEVIWAGSAPPGIISSNVSRNGQFPSALRYFPAVVLGTRNPDPDDPTITSFEENRIGNHLGSLDVAADVDLPNWNLYAYRQFVYDDGSLFYGTNIQDGLNGLRIRNQRLPAGQAFFLRQLTVEYLFTGSQGGDQFVISDDRLRGRDDYFNHSQFVDGWTYFGRTIGTPFITPTAETRPTLPQRYALANNRVSVYHLGLSCLLFTKIDVTTRLSYSLNAGTYAVPYLAIPRQFSGLLTISVPINVFGGTVLNTSLAVDSGGLLPNSVGAYIGLRKTGMLSQKASDRTGYMRFR